MKKVKRILALCAAGIAAVSMCACTAYTGRSGTAIEATSDLEETIDLGPDQSGVDFSGYRVGVSLADCTKNTYNSAYVQALNESMAAYDVDTTVFDAFGDEGQQAAQINTLISMNVDMIILWPVNSDTAVTWAKSIHDAGIPVLMANTNISSDGVQYVEGFVGPSGVDEAYQTAEQMLEDLEGQGNIVAFFAQNNYSPVIERQRGLKKALSGTSVELIEEFNNCPQRSMAKSYMEECLKEHSIGEIDAVFCYDDDIALGVFDAMEEQDRSGEMKVYVSASGNYDIISYIEDGMVAASAIQSPVVDAKTMVNYALDLLQGNELPSFNIYITTPIVTSENVDSLNLTAWGS